MVDLGGGNREARSLVMVMFTTKGLAAMTLPVQRQTAGLCERPRRFLCLSPLLPMGRIERHTGSLRSPWQ